MAGVTQITTFNYCSNSKNNYESFSMTTLEYWNNYYHDSFTVTHTQYELQGHCVFRFSGAGSIVNNDDIGLSEHLS